MSATNAIGDFDLNTIKLRKKIEFPDGTIQSTAATDGNEDLADVLLVGNDADGQDITGVGTLEVNTQIQLTPAGDTVNFLGEINQVATGVSFAGNQLTNTLINTGVAEGSSGLSVRDVGAVNGLYVVPNSQNNLFNPLVDAGNVSVVASSATQTLTLSNNNATTNGVKISGATMTMGSGGTSDTPTNSLVFNNPANTIVATTDAGMVVQSSTIEPTPTLAVKDVPTGQELYFIPKANAGNYQPMSQVNNQQIVAGGTKNTQVLEIVPWCDLNCGIRLQPSTTLPYAMIGAGGAGADPTVRIEMNKTENEMELFFNTLKIQETAGLPNSAGASSGFFLPVNINGTIYKIALLNNT
jgi:hypothetical protein